MTEAASGKRRNNRVKALKEDSVKTKSEQLKEPCGDKFDSSICTKEKGHHGKHFDDREGHWEMWTDQGKARVEAERAAKVSK
jgi:hypothetical protein